MIGSPVTGSARLRDEELFRAYDNLSVKARQALVPRREGKISSRVPTRSILPAESTTILSAMFKMRS